MTFAEKMKMNDLLIILKALADKKRLRIIKMLQQRTCCVCETTSILNIAPSTVSNHLHILKDAGIIEDMKEGKWVNYSLNKKTNNIFLNGVLPLLFFWLNSDKQVKVDLKKLRRTNRDELCNK